MNIARDEVLWFFASRLFFETVEDLAFDEGLDNKHDPSLLMNKLMTLYRIRGEEDKFLTIKTLHRIRNSAVHNDIITYQDLFYLYLVLHYLDVFDEYRHRLEHLLYKIKLNPKAYSIIDKYEDELDR